MVHTSHNYPLRSAGGLCILGQGPVGLEIKVALDGKAKLAANGFYLCQRDYAQFRKTKTKITKTKSDILFVRVNFGQEPGGLGVRGEQFDHR